MRREEMWWKSGDVERRGRDGGWMMDGVDVMDVMVSKVCD
jgi:hypothetical protein